MKWSKLLLFICLICIISACSSNINISTTNTSRPTNTPKPTITTTQPPPFKGKLFFDMNGSGLQDESSFILDSNRLQDSRQPLQTDLLNAINAYEKSHSEFKKGDLISISEPGLSGYQVCVEKECSTTSQDGSFSIPNKTGRTTALLEITDPNANNPALAMRYINEWIRQVTIPAYEIDGEKIPEQYLNDTVIIQIKSGINISLKDNNIGLTQGFLTHPLPKDALLTYHHVAGYDHDPRIGKVIGYSGDTIRCKDTPLCNPINSDKLNTDIPRFAGIYDSHVGYDFMFPRNNDKFFLTASLPGLVDIWVSNGIVLSITNTNLGFSFGPQVTNGEIYKSLLEKNVNVLRGQIIGFTGEAEYKAEHPEYSNNVKWYANYEITMLLGPSNPKEPDDYKGDDKSGGLEKDLFGVIDPNVPLIFPDIEKYSSWTVFNLPQLAKDILTK